MIIDAARFQQKERGYWDELETELNALAPSAPRVLVRFKS